MSFDAKKLAATYQLPPAVAGDIVSQCLQQSLRQHWSCWATLVGGLFIAGNCWLHGHAAGLWLLLLVAQLWYWLGSYYAREPIHAAARRKSAEIRRNAAALTRVMPRS